MKESTTTESLDDLLDQLDQKKSKPTLEESIRSLPKLPEMKQVKIKPRIKEKKEPSTWFDMKTPEITPELKRDLQIIKQRAALDPKRHYKKDKWQIPKSFQMGTIIGTKSSSITNDVLRDDTTTKYFKRKYSEIQSSKTSGRKSHYKKVKQARKRF